MQRFVQNYLINVLECKIREYKNLYKEYGILAQKTLEALRKARKEIENLQNIED